MDNVKKDNENVTQVVKEKLLPDVAKERLKKLKDIYKDVKDELLVVLPGELYKKLESFVENFEYLEEDDFANIPEDLQILLIKLPEFMESVKYKDVTSKPLTEEVNNKIVKDDKEIGIKHPKIKSGKSKQSFLLELQEGVGLGKITKIPLWNSGFWITIKPPKTEDIVNLQLKLSEEMDRIASLTTNLAFSNITTVFHKIVFEYVMERIADSSLDVPKKELINYISLLDLDTILLGVLQQVYYNGFDLYLPCKNNYNTEKDDEVKVKNKCSYVLEAKVDLSKLLWVDMSKIPEEALVIIANSMPKSVTVADIKKYKSILNRGIDNRVTLTLNNGKTIRMDLEVPNLKTYFNVGDIFILKLNKIVNELMENGILKNEKDKAVNVATKTLFLSIYSHFVKAIKNGDVEFTDRDVINEALEIISSNNKDTNEIIEKINNFITKSSVTTIGLPNFVCPVCKEKQETTDTFENIVPLNMVLYFFTLWTHRYMKLLEEEKEKQK